MLPGQMTLPGVEPQPESDCAKLGAAHAMKPSKAQQPCDVGLFSDDAKQIDLEDAIKTVPE